MTITVRLDGAPGITFEAATLQETRWNGWERPTFTRPQADIVAAWFTRRAHQGYPTITYDEAADAYTITDVDGEVTTHTATESGTYALGDAAWCWERFTCPPALAPAELADTWIRSRILADLGPRLTCHEAEALATLLRATGFSDEARTLIAQHATADDDPDVDSHWNKSAPLWGTARTRLKGGVLLVFASGGVNDPEVRRCAPKAATHLVLARHLSRVLPCR